jgi:hypothetical protein
MGSHVQAPNRAQSLPPLASTIKICSGKHILTNPVFLLEPPLLLGRIWEFRPLDQSWTTLETIQRHSTYSLDHCLQLTPVQNSDARLVNALATHACDGTSAPEWLVVVSDIDPSWRHQIRTAFREHTPVVVCQSKAPMIVPLKAEELRALTRDPGDTNKQWGAQC